MHQAATPPKPLSSASRRTVRNFVRTLCKAVEVFEPNTAGHLASTGRYAVALASRLRFRPAATRLIYLGAILHDVGKIAVPPALLLRQGRLSPLEFALVQEHPRIGWEIVCEAEFDLPVATVVKQHHERLDGSGYPEGLREGAILAEALVVAVADEVHALLSRRSYRDGLDEAAMTAILEADAVARLPPAYVNAAIDLVRAGTIH